MILQARSLGPAVRLTRDDFETGEELSVLGNISLVEAEFADRVGRLLPEAVDGRELSVVDPVCSLNSRLHGRG
ncbi:MAG: hypothetical protein J07HB67_01442, partial [halophilic archaeon J07HB67]